MYRARVEAVDGLRVKAGGKWLTCIGNRAVRAGDLVWTDGRCVYGNDRETSAPFVFTPTTVEKYLPIPLLFFDKIPAPKSQEISAAGYTLFPEPKIKLNYQEIAARTISNNFFFINNDSECRAVTVVKKNSPSDDIEKLAIAAVNLDNQQNTYELQKFRGENTLGVHVIKNGTILRKIDCSSKIKDLISETRNYARKNAGSSVAIPKDFYTTDYDPDSLHLYNEVQYLPDNPIRYMIVFPLMTSLADYPIYYHFDIAGNVYFDASIEGVILKRYEGISFFGLYPGTPQNHPWYDRRTASSSAYTIDFGVPWGVIENEQNWAFIVSVCVYSQASGWYISGNSAIPKDATVTARRTWLYTPTGAKELCYSMAGRFTDNDKEIDTPTIQRTFPVGDLIPIQDGYYFTINTMQLSFSTAKPYTERQNVATMNISIYDSGGENLWTGDIAAATYLTICKNKKIFLGVDSRGGFGLFDRDLNDYSSLYARTLGVLDSGLYLFRDRQLEQLIGGYLKNQKLRPMKKSKNWWTKIQPLEQGSEENE